MSVSAARYGYVRCAVCGRLEKSAADARCPRCGALLHQRKPDSLQRSLALLIAAAVLYVPANLLPIMETGSLFGVQRDTILSGVVYFWTSGSWELAFIIFFASVAVPMLKLVSLLALIVTVWRRRQGAAVQRTRLYRLLEIIGRWSMLDVYVVAILVALVQAQSLASISAGSGILAFGAVVILSMLATMAFDPRLIWDGASSAEQGENA